MSFLWKYLRRMAIGEIFDTADNPKCRQALIDNPPALCSRMASYASESNDTLPADIKNHVRRHASTFGKQIDCVRKGKTAHDIALYLLWLAALFTTITPIYLAVYFGARPALQREIVQKGRIFPELIAFALIGNLSFRIFWVYLYVTVAPQVPSVVMYLAVRVIPAWRPLYGTWPYTGGVIGAIALLLGILYGVPFFLNQRAKKYARSRPTITGEEQRRSLEKELADTEKDIADFNVWKKKHHPTRAIRQALTICSERAGAIENILRNRLQVPMGHRQLTKMERSGKIIIFDLMLGIVGVNTGANYRDPMALPIVLVIGLAMAGEVARQAFSERFSLEAVFDLFSLIGAPQFFQLTFGSIPLLGTSGQFLNFDTNMIWSTTVQVLLQWSIGNKIGPWFLKLCKLLRILKDKNETAANPPQEVELQQAEAVTTSTAGNPA